MKKRLSIKSKIELITRSYEKSCNKYQELKKIQSQDQNNPAIRILVNTCYGECNALKACLELLKLNSTVLIHTL